MSAKIFYPQDKIAIIFSLVIIPLQIYFVSLSVSFPTVLGFISLIALIFFNNKFKNRVIKFLRSYIHIPYYGLIFTSFQTYVYKLNPTDYDWLLLKADYTIFGTDLTKWFEQYISKGLTEVITLSYFSYYVLPTLTFILLYFSKNSESFIRTRNYLLSIVIGWYGAFIFYVLLPATGPDIAYPEHYSIPLVGLSPLTNTYLQNLSEYLKGSFVRNTYPSMHFGILLITNYFAYRYKRKYFWFCTLPL
ncbi:MAG TPA: phosphatase PAP2 family protein, partial [Ignavibacteria bacterium]